MITGASTVRELGEYLAAHGLTMAIERASALWAVFLYRGKVQHVGTSTDFSHALALAISEAERVGP